MPSSQAAGTDSGACSDWDSSSIASSRPGSPSPSPHAELATTAAAAEPLMHIETEEDDVEQQLARPSAESHADYGAVPGLPSEPHAHAQPSTAPQSSEAPCNGATDPAAPPRARPSLNMTAQELSEAKALILDLLGWGVPVAYLLRCGLAREAIYYTFTELNLRLPSDFDAAGIVPYEPPPDYAAAPR